MPDPVTQANNEWEAANAACQTTSFVMTAPVEADQANEAYDRQCALDGRPADPRRWIPA